MTEKTVQKIDVFISSPGDVAEERKVASEVIGQLNSMPYIADRCMLKPLSYEKIVPAAVGETAQKTVDRYMMEADKSDIFICILWSRMGTPVIDNEGKEYQSGTEYEFTTAYRANQKSGKPHILLYRSMKNLPNDANLKQVELVRAFFKSFDGKEADLKGFYKKYRSNEEFKDNLHRDLEVIISEIIQPEVAGKRPSVPKEIKKYTPPALPPYPLKLKEFVTQNRAEELKKAQEYLQAHQILFINGLGGIGKTTLARALVELRPSNGTNPFWFDFSKKMDATLEDVLEELSGYLDAPDIAGFRNEKRDAGQHDIDLLICELQNHEPVWLAFDNLETILESESTKFRDQDMDSLFISLRDNSHQAKIIITSRTLPVLRSGISYIDMVYNEKQELKGLKTRDAIDYLIKNGLEGLDSDELEKLALGVDGHPLALELLIQLVKKFGVKDTLKDLSMYQKLRESTIKKARRLFEKLAGDEKELLERISVFRRPESLEAMKIMFTDKTSDDAIGNLLDRSLLETDLNGNYWLHPLVQEFSYEDLKDKRDIHKLAYEYYRSLALPDPRTKKMMFSHLSKRITMPVWQKIMILLQILSLIIICMKTLIDGATPGRSSSFIWVYCQKTILEINLC